MENGKKKRPYRFGYAVSVCTILFAADYLWLGITALPENPIGSAVDLLSTAIAFFTGYGLLRKRYYGVYLLDTTLLLGAISLILEAYPFNSTGHVASLTVFIALSVVVYLYFDKRAEDFKIGRFMALILWINSFGWLRPETGEFRWTRWSSPGGKGYAVAAKLSLIVAAASAIWIYHITPHWWLAIPAAALAWFITPYFWSTLWAVARRFIERAEGVKIGKETSDHNSATKI